jgi:hypothetical protein
VVVVTVVRNVTPILRSGAREMIGEASDLVTLVLVTLSQQSGGGDLTAAMVVSKLTAAFRVSLEIRSVKRVTG